MSAFVSILYSCCPGRPASPWLGLGVAVYLFSARFLRVSWRLFFHLLSHVSFSITLRLLLTLTLVSKPVSSRQCVIPPMVFLQRRPARREPLPVPSRSPALLSPPNRARLRCEPGPRPAILAHTFLSHLSSSTARPLWSICTDFSPSSSWARCALVAMHRARFLPFVASSRTSAVRGPFARGPSPSLASVALCYLFLASFLPAPPSPSARTAWRASPDCRVRSLSPLLDTQAIRFSVRGAPPNSCSSFTLRATGEVLRPPQRYRALPSAMPVQALFSTARGR